MRLQDYGTLRRMALQRMAQHRAWRQPSTADAVAMVGTMLGLWEGVGYPTVSHRILWHAERTTAVWGTLGYGSMRAETATCGINRAGRDAFQNSTGSRGILCRAIPCKETMTCGIYRVGRDTVQNHTGSRGIPCHVGYNAVSDTKSCGIPRQPHVGAPCRVGYRANRTCRR